MRLSNNSLLQFFTSDEFQHHKKWYAKGLKMPVISPVNRMPSWQLIGMPNAVLSLYLKRYETDGLIELYNFLGSPSLPNGLSNVEVSPGVWNTLYYPFSQFTEYVTPIGEYQVIADYGNGVVWESEVFGICGDPIFDMLKMTWWHNENFPTDSGEMVFNADYKNIIWLNTDLSKPQYLIERVVENLAGHTFKIHQIWKKVMFFDMLATEGVADVMTKVGLHHNIEILYKGETYRINDLLPTVTWLKEGDLATITCRLEAGLVTQQTGSSATQAEYTGAYGPDYTSP